jgi:hypothetical protein
MNSKDLSEKFKCEIADEVKAAVDNKDRTIDDSPYKDYLFELLYNNDPFNNYYCKYDGSKRIFGKIYLILIVALILISYICAKIDPQIDFINFTIEIIVFGTFVFFLILIFLEGVEKKKAVTYYIPIIMKNLPKLENELNNPFITQERRQYIATVHYLANFLYTKDKYMFEHYKF